MIFCLCAMTSFMVVALISSAFFWPAKEQTPKEFSSKYSSPAREI